MFFSYTSLTAKSENVEKAAELQRITAEKEEADKKAADLKSAATAATAAQPSSATEESIRTSLKAELLAQLRTELKISSGNQGAAGKSQKQQRHQSVNQKGQDLGSGGSKGKGTTPPSTPLNEPRAGNGGGEGKATAPRASSKTSQKRRGAPSRVKFRLEQGCVQFLQQRSQQKPPAAKSQGGSSGSSSGTRGTRR